METTIDRDTEVKRLLTRDLDAGFTEVVRLHQGGVYGGAVRLTGSHDDGADVAQETFVRAYRSLSDWDADRILDLDIRPWLWTIALNLCRNRARRRRPEVPLGAIAEPISMDADPADLDLWNRRLSGLTEDQRVAVVLRYVLDLPTGDIAQATGRPEGTVRSDISRGLDRLRRTIASEVRP